MLNDCPNGEVRDLLPSMLHGSLADHERTAVESHMRDCVDCQTELGLLRSAHFVYRSVPVVDVQAIVAGLPAYRAPVRRSWTSWRTAAAIAVLAAGGSSVALLQRDTPSAAVAGTTVSAEPATTPVVGRAGVAAPLGSTPSANAAPARARELAMAGGVVSDLDASEVAALLKELESLDAVPSAEVDAGLISPVVASRGSL